MKKKLSEMDESDYHYLFGGHVDGGSFVFPYFNGYHDNGWRTTNSFKSHILEANKERLFERFDITEKEYSEIPNPNITISYNAVFPDGTKLKDVQRNIIIRKITKVYGLSNNHFRKGKHNFADFIFAKGIVITPNIQKKY